MHFLERSLECTINYKIDFYGGYLIWLLYKHGGILKYEKNSHIFKCNIFMSNECRWSVFNK